MIVADAVPAAALAALASLVEARSGLRFVKGRQGELATRVARAFAESGCASWQAYQDKLTSQPGSELLQQLIEALTVGETYFFRHRAYFDLLERELLPEIVARRRATKQLRVWCAGCATGEEAYSLAIAIGRVLPDVHDWQVSILATDLNRRFLARAEAGIYTDWSFRETDELFKSTYFETEGPRYRIRPEIRQLVRFAQLNLAEDGYPSSAQGTAALDLILCRNVLLYFRPELSQEVVGRFHAALMPGGWLVVGPSDARPGLLADFDMHASEGAVVYRRPADERGETRSGLLADFDIHAADAGMVYRRPAEDRPLIASPTGPTQVAVDTLPQPEREGGRFSVLAEGDSVRVPPLAMEVGVRFPPLARCGVDGAASAEDELDWRQSWLSARLCADEGELDQAEAHCQQAMARARLRPEPYYLYGTLRQARGDDAASLGAFRKALYADPTFVPALLAQAAIHRRGGAAERAQHALVRARRLLEGRGAEELVLAEDGLTVGRLRDAVEQALGEAC